MRFASPEGTITAPSYRVRISNFQKKKSKLKFSENFMRKPQKMSYLENYKSLSSHIWRQKLQLLGVPLQSPTIEIINTNFVIFFTSEFFEHFLKIDLTTVASWKLRSFAQSHLNAKLATKNSWDYSNRSQLHG